MNFFETLFEGIDLENEINVNENETFDMSEEDFEQAIEVMEANKFLVQAELDSLNVQKACLEAELSGINGFYLGEGLSDIKDKALELWEKFKEWVEGILAKVKVFFAKFMMSKKQMVILDAQYTKVSADKKKEAFKNLGLSTAATAKTAIKDASGDLAQAGGKLTSDDVSHLKTQVEELEDAASTVAKAVKEAITNDEFSGDTLASLHGEVVKPIGNLVRALETALKEAKRRQTKHDRLGRGNDPKNDSDAITQFRGIINAGNKIYATAIKYFFHEVKVVKSVITYAGKEAKLDNSTKKDLNKMKGRVKF